MLSTLLKSRGCRIFTLFVRIRKSYVWAANANRRGVKCCLLSNQIIVFLVSFLNFILCHCLWKQMRDLEKQWKKIAGCEIFVKKERGCRVGIPSSRPWYLQLMHKIGYRKTFPSCGSKWIARIWISIYTNELPCWPKWPQWRAYGARVNNQNNRAN